MKGGNKNMRVKISLVKMGDINKFVNICDVNNFRIFRLDVLIVIYT